MNILLSNLSNESKKLPNFLFNHLKICCKTFYPFGVAFCLFTFAFLFVFHYSNHNMLKAIFFVAFSALFTAQIFCQQPKVKSEKQDSAVVISIGGSPVLSYFFETKYPPTGVDTAFRRSAFIHPLRTLKGHELTRLQPSDHYHHFGIWNAWTQVAYEGDTLDFWNLLKKEGTVRFAGFKNIDQDGFTALQESVVLKNGTQKTALKERFSIKVSLSTEDYYLVDFDIEFACGTASPFHILQYRYAGLCWRTTGEWDNKNSEVLTSDGHTRLDADNTVARWFIAQGSLGKDYGGGVMLSHPTNYNHPEPLRVWPIDQYGRGDLMAMFSPTKTTDWLMEPSKTYRLRYRLVVFDGKMTREKAQVFWEKYAKE